MIPEALLPRAEEIFADIGGYTAAKSYFSDPQIVDICLFNGYTFILFPKYKPFEADLKNGLDVYNYIDLTELEYVPESSYHVLTADYNFMYESYPTLLESEEPRYIYGRGSKDINFFDQTEEGELYYLNYMNSTSPMLAQIIISHKVPISVQALNKGIWNDQQDRLDEYQTQLNELVFKFDAYDTITVYFRRGSFADNYREAQIAYSPNTEVFVARYNKSQYMSFTQAGWLLFRAYESYQIPALSTLEGLDVTSAVEILSQEGFSLEYNQNGRRVYIKEIDTDIFAEVDVRVVNDYFSSYTIQQYTQLALTELTGAKIQALKLIGVRYFVQSYMPEVGLRSPLSVDSSAPMTFMSKESFKLRGTLTNANSLRG